MSAAANAAGYLYAHGLLPVSNVDGRVDAPRPHRTVKPQPEPPKQARAPRIEYRKRRFYPMPSAA